MLKQTALNAGIGLAVLAGRFFIGHAVAGSIGATTLSGIITEGMIRVDHMTRGVAFIYGAVIAGAKLYPKLVKESFNNKREAVQALQKCFG